MSGLSIDSVGSYKYINDYMSSIQKKKDESSGSFADKLGGVTDGENLSITGRTGFEGAMVIPQPPKPDEYMYDGKTSLSKPKSDMTLEEYKQWFRGEMSQMPVSAWVRSSFSSGALVIKEEAFERMKSDPEYEKYVLNRVRSYYSASGLPIGSNNVSYEVIGASPEECYGYAGPAGNSGSVNSGEGESWWEKRHKKLEEILDEIEENQFKRHQAEKEEIRQAYFNQQKAERLLSSSLSGSDVNEKAVAQAMEIRMSSIISAYEAGTIL